MTFNSSALKMEIFNTMLNFGRNGRWITHTSTEKKSITDEKIVG